MKVENFNLFKRILWLSSATVSCSLFLLFIVILINHIGSGYRSTLNFLPVAIAAIILTSDWITIRYLREKNNF